jgi:hypothetical protein
VRPSARGGAQPAHRQEWHDGSDQGLSVRFSLKWSRGDRGPHQRPLEVAEVAGWADGGGLFFLILGDGMGTLRWSFDRGEGQNGVSTLR